MSIKTKKRLNENLIIQSSKVEATRLISNQFVYDLQILSSLSGLLVKTSYLLLNEEVKIKEVSLSDFILVASV